MTYCVAIKVNDGLIFASDSRTNAGVDNVSTFSKMHAFVKEGQAVLVLLSAGNLATTQSVITRLNKDIRNPGRGVNLYSVQDFDDACSYVGEVSRGVQRKYADGRQQNGFNVEATFILGGQIGDQDPGIALIYPEGNYLTATEETPFLQIGELKYGKTILDCIIIPGLSLEDAARCALVSLDSTMRSNISVGPPLELLIYRKDSLRVDQRYKYELDSPFYTTLRQAWSENIRQAFFSLPRFDWEWRG